MFPNGQPQRNVVLITGATGMVGSQLMAKLLARGVSVAVLARDSSQRSPDPARRTTISASQRIETLLSRFESNWGKPLARPTVLRGDLTRESLGLDPESLDWIGNHVNGVIHSAASLSFRPASESSSGEPYRTNVFGTANLIKVCRDRRIDNFHYVSTAYICGLRIGRVYEADHDCGQQFSNDYEHSKCQAENLLRSETSWQSPTIYRPSIVIDSTGLSPVTEDRTVYGAYSLFETLSSKLGLPQPGEWFRNLGFSGNERKNLVEAEWVAEAICKIFLEKNLHGRTYHLTDRTGTAISELEKAFHTVALKVTRSASAEQSSKKSNGATATKSLSEKGTAPFRRGQKTNEIDSPAMGRMLDAIAAPFVDTFRPYFRDDPTFDRLNIDSAIASLPMHDHQPISAKTIAAMIQHRRESERRIGKTTDPVAESSVAGDHHNNHDDNDPVVIVGRAVRLPGGIDNVQQFEQLLFDGQSAVATVPESRFDRDLYFDHRRGQVGKSYTQFGGCVSPEPLDDDLESQIAKLGTFDLTHRQFAQVAVKAWTDAGLTSDVANHPDKNQFAQRCGIFVGHSGGTDQGGPLAMATLADAALDTLDETQAFAQLPIAIRDGLSERVADRLREGRPIRTDDSIHFDAYSAASLAGRLLSLGGIREVIDAACASSLLALAHAVSAIRKGRIDSAIVGGATYNNVDNLILFSQSQACSESVSSPFDQNASGLISSEGYVAITITKLSTAKRLGLPIRGVIRDVGVSSDGRGKSLWAPRSEGQQLAIRRGYADQQPLAIDYLEAHATSTQVGDATELVSLASVGQNKRDLLVGSVKSNLGHTLEAAGLVGLVKLLISIDRGEIPPTINLKSPTSEFDWSTNKVRVVDKTTPWPKANIGNDTIRRCAVNAFGIGGLNGHAVIESASDYDSLSKPSIAPHKAKASELEPIAIVGRGVVLPGAFSVEAFGKLLSSDATSLVQPPQDRWLGGAEIGSSPFAVPTHLGGYITGYRFDGQPYRIPPKQVDLANPLQMMLIDAVEQAAKEADGGNWLADREKTAVVIGTIFGGEFSNHLQVGLRLPEICKHLSEELVIRGVQPSKVQGLVSQYRELMLRRHSAILDETGGFTASTLASRIAKTFDLMGGACAVDADDASGGLAVLLAVDQLRSNKIDAVVCGAARRSLDLVGFKDLEVRGRLADGTTDHHIPADCAKVVPGEGVAVLMLRRLSDAVKQGQKVLGIIDAVESGFCCEPNRQWRQHMQAATINQKIVSKVGYLAGAHSIIRIMADTVHWSNTATLSQPITSVAEDGFCITVHTRFPIDEHPLPQTPAIKREAIVQECRIATIEPTKISATDRTPVFLVNTLQSSKSVQRTVVIQGTNESDFLGELQTAIQAPAATLGRGFGLANELAIDPTKRFCAGVIADSEKSLASGLEVISKTWQRGQRVGVFDRQLAVLWDNGLGAGRVAWAFPGQGSQYSAIPQVVSQDRLAAAYLDDFDRTLRQMGLDGVVDDLGDTQERLGYDVWLTQLWVLAVSCTLSDSMRRGGMRPDLVFGHSFGECGAALQAGVMTVEQAIKFAKLRSESVAMTTQKRGQLLSIRANPTRVESVLAKLDAPLSITHHNSPLQTVIAGGIEQIEIAKAAFTQESIASIVIPVPAAYHSPSMSAARGMLKNAFSNQRLMPPQIGFFSTIRGKYLAEPASIRACLIDQLTHPLLYCNAIERLVSDGYRLLVEVGPSDVLTKLHRDIVGNLALCVSLDCGHHTHSDRLRLISLAQSFVTGSVSKSPTPTHRFENQVLSESDQSQGDLKTSADIEIVDVTRRGRARSNSEPFSSNHETLPVQEASPAIIDTVHNDAVNRTTPKASIDQSSVNRFLVDFVVELTGYHPDVIDFDADLEAELGVDSIKKAQVIGELAEWASLQLDLKRMRLADFNTLADIANLAMADSDRSTLKNTSTDLNANINVGLAIANGSPMPHSSHQRSVRNGSASSDAVSQTSHYPVFVEHANEPSLPENQPTDPVASLMIDFIVDQTGYSPEIIDLEADLEAELGVDSIKKAQLFGELASHFELQNVDLRRLRLADFPTLGSIRDFVYEHDTKKVISASAAPTNQLTHAAADAKKKMTRGAEADFNTRSHSPRFAKPFASNDRLPIPATGTCRFGLTLVDAPRRAGMPTMPRLSGGALVVGDNRLSKSLSAKLISMGVAVHCLSADDAVAIDETLATLWQACETPHLFITTPHDDDALGDLSTAVWNQRRQFALTVPFRICQLWMQRMIDLQMMDQASLVSVLNAGGDFGFSASNVVTPESGGLAGLTKAMLIEAWMRGYRQTPMKVIDVAPETSMDLAIEGIFAELAVPSHDEEVCVDGQSRMAVRPCYLPLSAEASSTASPPSRGGTWIVSGGGRGITALTCIALAEKYDLRLELLGTAPAPALSEDIRLRAQTDRAVLRREVMAQAQRSGENPIDAWRDLEKAIEIDATLRECQRKGIIASYHCVDVSDCVAVSNLIDQIRQTAGPIRGVIHGAGAGQDARFDRKRLDKVEKCIRAKVDGAIALAESTRNDPLEWFVGFGSISGRFGANGHTDYSLANDMLAKIVDRLRQQRPSTRCVTFHWHAWGDIGMATKPEAKLALEMIGMEFMPATEGLQHFLDEFERGGDLPEVLITDRNYIRKFFPGFGESTDPRQVLPMLAPSGRLDLQSNHTPDRSWTVTLDPLRDRFLSEHLVGGKPTLPFVIALEMMVEAAKHAGEGQPIRMIRDAEAIHALKFATEDAIAVEVLPKKPDPTDRSGDSDRSVSTWSICADLRRLDGRVVQASREHFHASVVSSDRSVMPDRITLNHMESRGDDLFQIPSHRQITTVAYLERDAAVFHGEPLRTLHKIAIDESGEAVGVITAPSPVQLGGERRPADGWSIPCAVMDGMLYACAMLAYAISARASLPVRFGCIHLGRLPDPGEPLYVLIRATSKDEKGMTLEADLIGLNNEQLLSIRDYRIHWIG